MDDDHAAATQAGQEGQQERVVLGEKGCIDQELEAETWSGIKEEIEQHAQPWNTARAASGEIHVDWPGDRLYNFSLNKA